MPQCYFLTVVAGSSVDQQSNNVTLFNLVEQINLPAGGRLPSGRPIPLEVHAYLSLEPGELGLEFEMRVALVHSATGLETFTEPAKYRPPTARLRTRVMGLPCPPSLGHYDVQVDFRLGDDGDWSRDSHKWPISLLEAATKTKVTH